MPDEARHEDGLGAVVCRCACALLPRLAGQGEGVRGVGVCVWVYCGQGEGVRGFGVCWGRVAAIVLIKGSVGAWDEVAWSRARALARWRDEAVA